MVVFFGGGGGGGLFSFFFKVTKFLLLYQSAYYVIVGDFTTVPTLEYEMIDQHSEFYLRNALNITMIWL